MRSKGRAVSKTINNTQREWNLRNGKILSLIRKTSKPTGKLKLKKKTHKDQNTGHTGTIWKHFLCLRSGKCKWATRAGIQALLESGHWPAVSSVSSGTVYLDIWFFCPLLWPLSFVPLERRKGHVAHTWHKLAEGFAFVQLAQMYPLATLSFTGPLTQFLGSHITSIWNPVLITDSEAPINNVQHTYNTCYMWTHLNAFWILNVPKMENSPLELCNIWYPGVAIWRPDWLLAVWVLCNWKLNGKC